MISNKPKVEIRDWWIATNGDDCHYGLIGKVRNHPNIADDHLVHTSTLLRIDFETMQAETMNSIYMLMKEDSPKEEEKK